MKYIAVLLPALLLAGSLCAQQPPQVNARFSADSVMIGDQFRLRVEVVKDRMQMVGFPEFGPDSFQGAMEILEESPVDTVQGEGRSMTLRKEYLMTSFDEGIYRLGRYPLLYVDKNITDTIWSRDSLGITVHTFPIDTVNQTIFDIKPPLAAPVRFGEFSLYLLFGLLGLAAIGLLVWYLLKRQRNRPLFGRPAVLEPAHVTAIRELEKVHSQKLWQSGRHKQYYTRITDILREYLERRFGIKAMEMTTDEIVERIGELAVSDAYTRKLAELLQTADFVKFAKFVPDADRNEMLYNDAYFFIEETKDAGTDTEPTALPGDELLRQNADDISLPHSAEHESAEVPAPDAGAKEGKEGER